MSDDKEVNTESTADSEQPQPTAPAEEVAEAAADEAADESDNGSEEAAATELTEAEKLAAHVEELDDLLLRTVAEFDNYKKRTARRFEEIVRGANDQILLELLEVVDNFERALDRSNSQADHAAYREGMKLIHDQLTTLLSRHDVLPIEAVGKPFDPHLHEAVMQSESDEYPEGTVALEIGKGYRQGERVLRHSKVGVAKAKLEETDDKENGTTENDA